MLKVLSCFNNRNLLKLRSINSTVKRYFLSDSYKCTEAWQNRLKSPAFQKIDFDDLYHQLERNFQIGYKVSVLDVDLFVNGISDESQINELEDVLFKLRLNPECGVMFDSTNHAAVRWYILQNKKHELLNVLSERLTYGIFLDHYLANMLMDGFLKENDPLSAVKVAVLQMYQEDCNHPIMTPLALHSCFKYLNSDAIWLPVQDEEDPDEEPVKVKVEFLKNPYFDDHFDIKVPNHLIGKTMVLFGREKDGPIGVSSQLVGYVLYEKYSDAVDLLDNVLNKNIGVYNEAVVKGKEYLKKKPKQAVEESGDAEKKEPESEEVTKYKKKLLLLLEKVGSMKSILQGDLEKDTEEAVKKAVAEYEKRDIENQCQVYKKWEKERELMIEREIEEDKRASALAEIEKIKKELAAEEEKLFYFDREEKLELVVERKKNEMENIVFYKGKGKHKEKSEEEYIPPTV